MMSYFVGILDCEQNVWGVRIPDLPGCHGGGASAEEAIADAISAAREWLDRQRTAGGAAPVSRTVAQVLADPATGFDAEAGESAIMLPVVLDQGRTLRANVTFDAGLLEAIDAEATRRGVTRSAFLASAARDKIESGKAA